MQMKKLGASDLEVTELCLGTMTFGTQTPEDDAHRQIDMALDAGINFLDTAEMYPVNPVLPETVGRTEEIVGNWIAASGRRNDIVVATKVSGKNDRFVRRGRDIDGETIVEALEGSLRRLQTDMIDLYQLHWPNRGSYHFRQYWSYDPTGRDRAAVEANMVEVLEAMAALQKAGKVRQFGLSNESAWGTAAWLRLAEQTGTPRMVSIQNEYSLMCRLFDTDLAELCCLEDVDLLAYSPLAAGLLTGKYRGGVVPEGSRMSLNRNLGGRVTERVWPAAEAYLAIAEKFGLDPVQMALRWAADRPFMGSVIFGATSLEQLERSLGATEVRLSDDVLGAIATAHHAHPMPY